MLDNKGFNVWANNYDETVEISEKNNTYPFAGYTEILNKIFNEVIQKKNSRVLDIGFGTGVLANKLYENGCQIDGLDFSSRMISIAKSKMPDANLVEWDISNGLPYEFYENKYDSIISTYTLHHLNDKDKISFMTKLQSLLKEYGKIFIGDIAFETREKLEKCRQDNLDCWDTNEFYFVYEEINPSLKNKCNFYPVSYCGGVLTIAR